MSVALPDRRADRKHFASGSEAGEQTLAARFVADVPERLIGDKAYDSDRVDEQMRHQFGTEMITQIEQTAASKPKIDGCCADMCGAGRSNDSSPGSSISAGWWFVTNTMLRIFKAFCISGPPSSC